MNRRFRWAALCAAALLVQPGEAGAQPNLEDVSIFRVVEGVDGGAASESAFAELVVVGDGISSAELGFPSPSLRSEALVQVTPREWLLRLDFVDMAELDAEFPAGTYELDVNGGERVTELPYAFPAVPSPAIGSPEHESDNNSPTTTEFSFSPCPPAVCDDANDHVFVTILRDTDTVASAFLPAGSSAWSPPELDEDEDFSFFVDNTAFRVGFQIDGADSFLLFNWFIHSDRVDFSTGFRGIDEAPQGDFSVVVTAAASGILDHSGNVTTTLGGVDLDYDFEVAPTGKISGDGAADVDGDTIFETPVSVKGKLSGRDGALAQKVTVQIKSKAPGSEASAKYSREEDIALASGAIAGEERLKGTVLGAKLDASGPLAAVLATAVDWQLDFESSTVDGRKLEVSGVLTYAGGSTIPLEGRGTYNSGKGTSSISLKSSGDDRGISIKLSNLTVDEMGNVTGGDLDYRAFGQRGRVALP